MEVISELKNIRISPRKMRFVAGELRNLSVEEAMLRLRFTPKDAAQPIIAVIKTAKADASHNFKLKEDGLKVKEVLVSEGPTYKRGRPAARGSYHPIAKRTSHLKVVLEG